MTRRFPVGLMLAAALLAVGCGHDDWLVPREAPSDGDPAIAEVLDPIRYDSALPGIGAAILEGGVVTSQAVVGFRALGHDEGLTVDDAFHLGSNGKAMTASVAALLAEDGLLDWDTPLSAAFPEATLDAGYAAIVLSDLFTHRAGLPRDPTAEDFEAIEGAANSTEARRVLAARILGRPPAIAPGTLTYYSNAGYMLAGAAIEAAAGMAFVDALQTYLLDPLTMSSCGPYAPGTSADVFDAPRGHTRIGNVRPPGLAGDLLAVYEPAGLVHCSLSDWARFVADHLHGARGEPGLLDAASYARLHTPPSGSDYAYGWIVATDDRGRALLHDGSNGFFSSLVVIRVEENRAGLFVTNIGGNLAGDALLSAAVALDPGAP